MTVSGQGIETQTEQVIVDISNMDLGTIPEQKESGEGGDNTMLYIGIGAVAILAVAGAVFIMMRRKK